MHLPNPSLCLDRCEAKLSWVSLLPFTPSSTFSLPATRLSFLTPLAITTNSMAEQVARTAKEAFDASQLLDSSERHRALLALKEALTLNKDEILAANAKDIEVGRRHAVRV